MRYLVHSMQRVAVGSAFIFRIKESLFFDEDGGKFV
jgi:hypothetical protein